MKLRSVFFLLMMGFFVIGVGWAIVSLVSSGQESFNNQIKEYLVSVIDSNNERIHDLILEVEEDVLFLSESERVKNILKKEVLRSDEATRLDVEGGVYIVSKEIDNYIKAHPEMTLEDLRGSKEFREIANQKIGETGYSALADAESGLTYFHIYPEIEGTTITDSNRSGENLKNIFRESIEGESGGGFYNWLDVDGETKRKYIEFRKIRTRTADGVALVSGTSAYVDDYLVAQDISDDLKKYFTEFNAVRNYHNILFLSKDGRVVYLAGAEGGLGSDLKNIRSGFGNISSLVNVLKDDDIGFYGPFIGHRGDVSTQFAAASRVYNGGEFLGTIAIIEEMSHINDILEEMEFFQSEEQYENYLVSKDGLLLTPIKLRDVDIMVQEIRTDNVEECLGDFREAVKRGISVEEYDILEKEEGIEKSTFSFLNFNGDLTIGLHRPIGRLDWCLLSEVDIEGVLKKPMEKSFRDQIMFRLLMFVIVVMLAIGASLFIDKRYVLERKKFKRYPCGIKRRAQPRYCKMMRGRCKTYPNGRCGKIMRSRDFFVNLNLVYYLLFALIFATAYFFFITSFFQGWQNAKFFDDIPDLLVFVVGFMIFVVGLKMRDARARGFIIYGGLFICLKRMIEIPFQEYQVILGHLLTPFLWVPILIIEFTGFLFLLTGYRRMKNV